MKWCGQYRLITYTTLLEDVDTSANYASVGTERMQEIYRPSAQFCCESKIALNNKSLLKEKKTKSTYNYINRVKGDMEDTNSEFHTT